MRNASLAGLMSALFLVTGCGVVQLPGLDKKSEARKGPPPPPPTEPVNPITIDGEILDLSTAGIVEASSSAPFEGRPPPPPPPPPALPSVSLANINAMKCSQVGDIETNSLAEIMNATAAEPNVQPQAVNAQTVSMLDDFPGIVKLEPKRDEAPGVVTSGHCGATRIAESWFVTAAHCVDQAYDRIELIAGTTDISSPFARRIEADAVICHGGYAGETGRYANDIALLHIPEEAVVSLSETPISDLEPTNFPLTSSRYPVAHMAGWGLTGFEQELSNTLQTADLSLVGSGPATIIVSSKTEAGPCIGDSGGPLFITEDSGIRTLVGVLSVIEARAETGQFCEGDYQARYTNMAGFIDWIDEVMLYCSLDPDLCARN